MKKIFLMVLALFTLTCLTSTAITEAGVLNKYRNKTTSLKVCALIIGDPDVKSKDFVEKLEIKLNEGLDTDKYAKVVCGTEIQSLYQNYWMEKGELEEGKLTKPILHDFVKYSGYDRCLFLVVSSPEVETSKISLGIFGSANNIRASIEVKGFLADAEKVLKVMSVTKNNHSETSELRAKRGAFRKCMKEMSEEMRPLLFKKTL